jgi:transcription initiation factor TFIIIB Brf1 subunit/transcription initiation factor TFIIB
MSLWRCAIGDCEARFEDVESAIVHQTNEHERHECQVCGTVVPEGYFAIRHAFDEHTRAEYVRSYDADSSAVRVRESVKDAIEKEVDLRAVVEQLDIEQPV